MRALHGGRRGGRLLAALQRRRPAHNSHLRANLAIRAPGFAGSRPPVRAQRLPHPASRRAFRAAAVPPRPRPVRCCPAPRLPAGTGHGRRDGAARTRGRAGGQRLPAAPGLPLVAAEAALPRSSAPAIAAAAGLHTQAQPRARSGARRRLERLCRVPPAAGSGSVRSACGTGTLCL